ncbi:MAG TPA: long-chain fatty acid--CoA ligase [Burkholderiales bacterium]|nr:long-chain fatty acid--CoA ligase [Burkholderiales bacterium]
MADRADVIPPELAVTLDGLFSERVRRSPDAVAYTDFDEASGEWRDHTWAQMDRLIGRWQAALQREPLQPGDRVAIILRNSPTWVALDQAAMGLGLVLVPLYTQDRPDNVAYIIQNCGAKLLLFEKPEQWAAFADVKEQLASLVRVLCLQPLQGTPADPRLSSVAAWLPESGGAFQHVNRDPHRLASIIYTSGTTGRPKGVMLSHHNMLSNAYNAVRLFDVSAQDTFLSFLPLSHTFERTCGYYLTVMAGARVAYARSITQLAEDLVTIRPTLLISVPRIYERVYAAIKAKLADGPAARRKLFELATAVGWARFEHQQGRGPWRPGFLLWPVLQKLVADKVLARLGGRLRAAVSGGAALPPDVARVFIGLGLPLLQGYGLTETSPVVSGNRVENNVPASIGQPIPGVQVKIGDRDALLVKGPNVMLGYWQNPEATKAMFTADGWLNTGDTARINGEGRIFITGRLKEIIVLSNGEKVPPVDMEAAIARDPFFEQVMVIGEGKPYLSVFVVPNKELWVKAAAEHGLDPASPLSARTQQAEQLVLERINAQIKAFPGYAQIRRATVIPEAWTIENGLLTPTLKLKRARVLDQHRTEYEQLYAGH